MLQNNYQWKFMTLKTPNGINIHLCKGLDMLVGCKMDLCIVMEVLSLNRFYIYFSLIYLLISFKELIYKNFSKRMKTYQENLF